MLILLTKNVHEISQFARLLRLFQLDVELAQAVQAEFVHINQDLLRLQPNPSQNLVCIIRGQSHIQTTHRSYQSKQSNEELLEIDADKEAKRHIDRDFTKNRPEVARVQTNIPSIWRTGSISMRWGMLTFWTNFMTVPLISGGRVAEKHMVCLFLGVV